MIKWIKRKIDGWRIDEIRKNSKSGVCSIHAINFITGNNPYDIADYLDFYNKQYGSVVDTINYLNDNGYYAYAFIPGDDSLKDIDIRDFIKDNLTDDEIALILFDNKDGESGHAAAANTKSDVGLFNKYSKSTFQNFIKITKGRYIKSEDDYIINNIARDLDNDQYEITINRRKECQIR